VRKSANGSRRRDWNQAGGRRRTVLPHTENRVNSLAWIAAALISFLLSASTAGAEAVEPKRAAGTPCSAGVICVGAGGYDSLGAAVAVAHDGDVIEVIAGTYRETVRIDRRNLVIRGVGDHPHFDCSGLRLKEDKSCLLLAADNIMLDNLEISGAVISADAGANGACIRNEPNLSFILRNIACHGSQDGILTDGGTIVIDNSEFFDNGWDDSTHNVYFSGDCPSATIRSSTFRDARAGHEFKSRCARNSIIASSFLSTHGSRNVDIPDGGETQISGGIMSKAAEATSSELIGFAGESCRNSGMMEVKDMKIVNSRGNAVIHNFDKCKDQAITLENMIYDGRMPRLVGLVVIR
jgi:hypothetical protein